MPTVVLLGALTAVAAGCSGRAGCAPPRGAAVLPAPVDLGTPAPRGSALVVPRLCDPVNQDCAPDAKCTMIDDGTGALAPRCQPLGGQGVAGAECHRTDGGAGFDDCGRGLFCSSQGSLGARHCRALCRANTDCHGAGVKCLALTDTEGLCVPICTVLGHDCPAGSDCSWLMGDIDGTSVYGTCRSSGSVDAGEACARVTDCAPSTTCLDPMQVSRSTCTRLCDRTHPCPSGACHPIPPLPDGAGFCG